MFELYTLFIIIFLSYTIFIKNSYSRSVFVKINFFLLLPFVTAIIVFSANIPFAQKLDNEAQPNSSEMPPEAFQSKKIVSPRETKTKISRKKLDNLKKLIAENPHNIDYLLKAAELELMLANFKNAVDFYRKAVILMKKNPDIQKKDIIKIQRKIIYLFLRTGKIDIAVVEYKRLCDIEPDNLDLKRDFAGFLVQNNYPRRAFLIYKQILKNNPDDKQSLEKIMALQAQHYVSKAEINSILNLNK